jgi:hypothetical protein
MAADHIKYRNMLMQVVLMIVTLGFYAVYWYYVTLKGLHTANGKEASADLWTVLALVPIANLFAYWHYASESVEFVDQKYPAIVLFLAWIIFFPVAWYLVQSELNKAATGELDARPTYST